MKMNQLAPRLLACCLSLLLALDTASAGWWLRARHAEAVYCPPAPVCVPMACPPVDCCVSEWTVADCGGPCGDCGGATATAYSSPMPVSDCGCGVTTSGVVTGDTPTHVYAEPTPAPAAPTDDGFGSGAFRSDNAAEPATAIEEPAAEPADLFADESPAENNEPAENDGWADSRAEELPADDLFAEEPEAMPADEPMPAEEAPADDLFGEMDEEAPAQEEMAEPLDPPAEDPLFDDAGDDLFGEETPADEPMAEEAPADDSLFGDDSGDLFGEETPADEPPMDELPMDEAPAEESLFDDGDDLFGEPAEEAPVEEAPMEEAPAEEAADDLFGGDDFGAEEFGTDDFGSDDFGAEAEPPMEEAAPMEETPADEPAGEEDFDDLFGGFGAILREPGGVDSTGERTWVDNTGRFSCVGRMVAVEGGSVRVLKPTGAVTTVPLSRLSQSDLEFVSRQAAAQYEADRYEMAQREKTEKAKQVRVEVDGFRTAQR